VVTLLGFAVLVRRAVVRVVVVLAGLLAAAFTVVLATALVFFAGVRAGAARRVAVERPVLRAFVAGFLFRVGVVARAMAEISKLQNISLTEVRRECDSCSCRATRRAIPSAGVGRDMCLGKQGSEYPAIKQHEKKT
jgi:hypothetical protein